MRKWSKQFGKRQARRNSPRKMRLSVHGNAGKEGQERSNCLFFVQNGRSGLSFWVGWGVVKMPERSTQPPDNRQARPCPANAPNRENPQRHVLIWDPPVCIAQNFRANMIRICNAPSSY